MEKQLSVEASENFFLQQARETCKKAEALRQPILLKKQELEAQLLAIDAYEEDAKSFLLAFEKYSSHSRAFPSIVSNATDTVSRATPKKKSSIKSQISTIVMELLAKQPFVRTSEIVFAARSRGVDLCDGDDARFAARISQVLSANAELVSDRNRGWHLDSTKNI